MQEKKTHNIFRCVYYSHLYKCPFRKKILSAASSSSFVVYIYGTLTPNCFSPLRQLETNEHLQGQSLNANIPE